MDKNVQFIETEITGKEPTECGDGRPGTIIDSEFHEIPSPAGPKIFGGDAAIAQMHSDFEKKSIPVDEAYVRKVVEDLEEKGFRTGVHRDDQADGQKRSGCGRCDRSDEIVQKKVMQRDSYKEAILDLNEGYGEILRENNINIVPDLLDHMFDDIQNTLNRPDITGENLLLAFEVVGSTVETVHGPHEETVAFLNLKRGITLDKQKLNDQGQQAFNVDLMAGVDRASAVNIDPSYAAAWLLADSLATREILAPHVELKIHS